MSNDINDYNFILPDELIAQLPTKKRSDARLLVVGKEESKIQDSSFSNILSSCLRRLCLSLITLR